MTEYPAIANTDSLCEILFRTLLNLHTLNTSLLSSLDFVKKVSSVSKTKALIAALQDDEKFKASIVKRKNKAIAKYL